MYHNNLHQLPYTVFQKNTIRLKSNMKLRRVKFKKLPICIFDHFKTYCINLSI